MKILIVDDSELIRDRLRNSLLAIENVEIMGDAKNGIEALQIIQDKTPDLIILDIRMQEMNGLDVLKKMKETESESSVCIFTNYPYPQYKTKCFELGADYFFDKNQNFTDLSDLIRKLSMKNNREIDNNKLAIHRKNVIDNHKISKTKIADPQK